LNEGGTGHLAAAWKSLSPDESSRFPLRLGVFYENHR
jgi:hypothetical protein